MSDIAATRRAIRLYRRLSLLLLWGLGLMIAALLVLPQMAHSAEPDVQLPMEQRFTNTGETWVNALYAMPVTADAPWRTIRLRIEAVDPVGVTLTLSPAPRDGVMAVAAPPIPPGGALIVTLDPADAVTRGLAVDVATGLPLVLPSQPAVRRVD